MRDFMIFGDSTCDLDKVTRERYNVDYVAMNYIVDDVEYVASLDWESHSVKEFYDLMRNGKRVFTTQVPRASYEEKFKAALEQGKDVLYVSCSSALSGSINIARVVAEELNAQYPDNKVYCVDSLISSLGQGHLLIIASNMRAEGKEASEVAAYLDSVKLCMNQQATVGSLEYLSRAGRIKASKAFFGNLFGVKPLIISDTKGQNYAWKKAKGAAGARRALAEMTAEVADGNYDTLYITHADCLESAEALRDEILAIAPFKEVIIGTIGPIVGASVGPGTYSAYCYGKEVTIEGNE